MRLGQSSARYINSKGANGARQLGPAARLEPKGLDYRPPRGENAADGPRSRAPFRPETRSARSHPGIRQMPATHSAVRDRRYSADATPHRPRAESPGASGEEGTRPDLPRCFLAAQPGGGLRGGNRCFLFPTNYNRTLLSAPPLSVLVSARRSWLNTPP